MHILLILLGGALAQSAPIDHYGTWGIDTDYITHQETLGGHRFGYGHQLAPPLEHIQNRHAAIAATGGGTATMSGAKLTKKGKSHYKKHFAEARLPY